MPEYTYGLVKGLSAVSPRNHIFLVVNRETNLSFEFPRNVRLLRIWNEGLRSNFQIAHTILRIKPDIVHVQYEFSLYGGPTTVLLSCLLFLVLRVAARIPIVISLHEVINPKRIDENFMEQNLIKIPVPFARIGVFVATTLLANIANLILVHSLWQRQILLKSYRINPQRVKIIPHGTFVYPRKEIDPKISTKAIFFGFLTPRKGLESLVMAFSKLSRDNVELSIVGGKHRSDNGYYESVAQLCREITKPGMVHFEGYLTDAEVHDRLSKADFAVFPYITTVSISGALCHAIGHCLPIIASNLQPFSEYLLEGENCILIPPNDEDALRKAVEFLADNPECRLQMSENMRRFALQISWKAVGKLTDNLYQDLICHDAEEPRDKLRDTFHDSVPSQHLPLSRNHVDKRYR